MLFASSSCYLCSSDVLVPITIIGSTWDDCLCFHVCLVFGVEIILFPFFERGGGRAESETDIYPKNNWLSISNTCAGFNEGFI